MSDVRVIVPESTIAKTIDSLASEINRDFRHDNPAIVCVMKAGALFSSHLCSLLTIEFDLDYVFLGRNPTRIICDVSVGLRNRRVLIVDTVVDTGETIRFLKSEFANRNPASVSVCALMNKREKNMEYLDYCAIEIPDVFVYGYGLDLSGGYRGLNKVLATV